MFEVIIDMGLRGHEQVGSEGRKAGESVKMKRDSGRVGRCQTHMVM